MSLTKRVTTNATGDPVCVITITGYHDIVRFADRMTEWQCEFATAGRRILRSARRGLGPERWAYLERTMFGRKLPR